MFFFKKMQIFTFFKMFKDDNYSLRYVLKKKCGGGRGRSNKWRGGI